MYVARRVIGGVLRDRTTVQNDLGDHLEKSRYGS